MQGQGLRALLAKQKANTATVTCHKSASGFKQTGRTGLVRGRLRLRPGLQQGVSESPWGGGLASSLVVNIFPPMSASLHFLSL